MGSKVQEGSEYETEALTRPEMTLMSVLESESSS